MVGTISFIIFQDAIMLMGIRGEKPETLLIF